MPGLLDPTELMQPGMGASQYAPNPNFTGSLAAPQISANPRPGFGNIVMPQAPPPTAGAGAGAGTAPTSGLGLTNADVSQALGQLYSSLGPGVDWVKYTGGAHGLLGDAANAQGNSPLANALTGFQQYQDIDKQLKDLRGAMGDTAYHGREGGGIV